MAAINCKAISEMPKISIIRRRQVEIRTGLSRSTIYSKLSPNPKRPGDYDRTFPKPVKLGTGKAVGWVESEIDSWLTTQAEKRHKAEETPPSELNGQV